MNTTLKMKSPIHLFAGLVALGLVTSAHGAVIDFTTTPTVGLNNVTQLSTTGTLVDAAHFGDAGKANVTANGINFVARGLSSPTLSITFATLYASNLIYQPNSHAVGFTSITGMTLADQNLMFNTMVYSSPNGASLVTLSGLTIGNQYELQLLLVNDNSNLNLVKVSNNPAGTVYGPFDVSNNAVQLITGTFTADAATQTFNQYGYTNNVELNAFQLRQVPEPSMAGLFVLGCLPLIRRKRSKC